MKKKILAGLILAGSTVFAAPRVSFGVGFGGPGPVVVSPRIVAAVPPCPGPGYTFVNGYWRAPERFEKPRRDFERSNRIDHHYRAEHVEHSRR